MDKVTKNRDIPKLCPLPAANTSNSLGSSYGASSSSSPSYSPSGSSYATVAASMSPPAYRKRATDHYSTNHHNHTRLNRINGSTSSIHHSAAASIGTSNAGNRMSNSIPSASSSLGASYYEPSSWKRWGRRDSFMSKSMLSSDIHNVIERGQTSNGVYEYQLHILESQGFRWNKRLFDRTIDDDEDLRQLDQLPVKEVHLSDSDIDWEIDLADDSESDSEEMSHNHSNHSQDDEDIFMLES